MTSCSNLKYKTNVKQTWEILNNFLTEERTGQVRLIREKTMENIEIGQYYTPTAHPTHRQTDNRLRTDLNITHNSTPTSYRPQSHRPTTDQYRPTEYQ